MISYSEIVKNFKNRDYFLNILEEYNSYKKIIRKRDLFKFRLTWGISSLMGFIIVILFSDQFSTFVGIWKMIGWGLAILYCVFSTSFFITGILSSCDFFKGKYYRLIKSFKQDFFKDICQDSSLLKDISSLAVDEKGKSILRAMANDIMNEKEQVSSLEKFETLLNHYQMIKSSDQKFKEVDEFLEKITSHEVVSNKEQQIIGML